MAAIGSCSVFLRSFTSFTCLMLAYLLAQRTSTSMISSTIAREENKMVVEIDNRIYSRNHGDNLRQQQQQSRQKGSAQREADDDHDNTETNNITRISTKTTTATKIDENLEDKFPHPEPTCKVRRTTQLGMRHELNDTFVIEFNQFMDGPGLRRQQQQQQQDNGMNRRLTVSPSNVVVCEFRMRHWSFHFPHALEQLLPCWSWFIEKDEEQKKQSMDSGIERILIHPAGHMGFPDIDGDFVETSLITGGGLLAHNDSDGIYWASASTFLLGVIEAFRDGLNVTFTSDPTPQQTELAVHSVESQQWHYPMHKPSHAHALSRSFLSYYQERGLNNDAHVASDAESGCGAHSFRSLPRIAVLNRYRKQGRSLLNHKLLATSIESRILRRINNGMNRTSVSTMTDSVVVPLVYFDGMSFFEQVSFYANDVDILISPHGAQLTGMFNMPRCGGLIEIFPKGYYWPEYFGSMARSTGLSYQSLYVSNGMLDDERIHSTGDADEGDGNWDHREVSKKFNMCPDVDVIVEQVQRMVDQWQSCIC